MSGSDTGTTAGPDLGQHGTGAMAGVPGVGATTDTVGCSAGTGTATGSDPGANAGTPGSGC